MTIEADGVGRYPPDVESALYFCCLEALQNVAKYAHAAHAEVRLSATGDELAFEVLDDGDGFDTKTMPLGSGLQGMADRLEALGGILEVRSEPGAGTTVAGRIAARRSSRSLEQTFPERLEWTPNGERADPEGGRRVAFSSSDFPRPAHRVPCLGRRRNSDTGHHVLRW